MQYFKLKEKLKDFILFTQHDIKMIDNSFQRQRLNEWQKKGYIKKIIKGYYIFSDLELNESVLFSISNKIYQPSYISFEMALSYYGLIPESVYGITAASSRKTQNFKSTIAEYFYHKIKPSLMFGYKLVKYKNQAFKIADIEKAILDYFYIKSHFKTIEDFEDLRIDKNIFTEQVNINKLNKYLKSFNSTALSRRIRKLMRYIKNAYS